MLNSSKHLILFIGTSITCLMQAGCVCGSLTVDMLQYYYAETLDDPKAEGYFTNLESNESYVIVSYRFDRFCVFSKDTEKTYIALPVQNKQVLPPFDFTGRKSDIFRTLCQEDLKPLPKGHSISEQVSNEQIMQILSVEYTEEDRNYAKQILEYPGFIKAHESSPPYFQRHGVLVQVGFDLQGIAYNFQEPIVGSEIYYIQRYGPYSEMSMLFVPQRIPRLKGDITKSKFMGAVGMPFAFVADIVWLPTIFVVTTYNIATMSHRAKKIRQELMNDEKNMFVPSEPPNYTQPRN